MPRYFTRPVKSQPVRASWYDDAPLLPPITVSDHEPVDTGIVDHRGDPIMRSPCPIGFGRHEEW